MNKDVLFFYTTTYSGHGRVAEVLEKTINLYYPEIKTKSFNAAYFYPVLAPLLSQFYLEVIKNTPQIWNYIYDNQEVKSATEEIRKLFNIINMHKLKKLLKLYNPKVLVCTHSLPANVIAYWKQRNGLSSSLIGVITDHIVHSYWIHKSIDYYFVPNKESKQTLTNCGIPESKICVSGIPIDLTFNSRIEKSIVRKYFKLEPDIFTVLILGGNHGLLSLYDILLEITKKHLPVQCFVITGLNKFFFTKLKRLFARHKNIHIYGYVKNISLAMDTADLIITKPGGLTTQEAIAKNLPMIIIEPLPGQEEKNATYLTRHRLAIRCNKITEVPDLIKKLLHNRDELLKFSKRQQLYATPYSSKICADKIVEFIHTTNETKTYYNSI